MEETLITSIATLAGGTFRDLDDTQKDIYRTNLPYRQYMNLRHRLNLLERYKIEFNN
ncbi:hypothetical protein [Staphylococcus auricularis]|uniref:hypothetical protein n=1 Tax=Staphylococcus auricularis TaxID=29379 RepID=UPI001F45F8D8|nr:hypothetical protein [Staphylococcus auricularis]MCE5038410.1 hypothetical protein [Staphylococcus auricularis]